MRGKVELVQPGCALLRSKSATITVYFFDRVTPPTVRTGDTIALCGRMLSEQMQTVYSIQDAILLKKGYKMAITKLMKKYSVAPKEYMDLPERYREG